MRPGPVVAPLFGPWADASLFGRRWPGPGRPASTAAGAAILAAAVVAALAVPLDRPGVGWSVAAIAGVAALIVARVLSARPGPTAPQPLVTWHPRTLGNARFLWSAATVALLAVGTFRAAGWLFLLCLVTAAVTGILAVTGGRSARGMVLAVLLAPVAGLRALPWLTHGLTTQRRGAGRSRLVATIAVSVLLLIVFGSLFASADAAFARIVTAVVPDIDAETVTRWIFVFAVTTFALGGAAFLRAAPPDLGSSEGARRRVTRLEWAIPLSLLVLLFALFVGVQLTVLFGGSRHVVAEGLTYAEYARSGFWQLLVVTGLTLPVLAGAARWAPRDTHADRVLIRAVLGTLAVLTLVIVASALHRMDLYADTYGLTRLRVLVALCELWLGAVFLLILGAGVRLRAAWLPRTVVAAGVLALLGLAAANPDRVIADHNVTRYEKTGKIDTSYLSQLSADAVPALDRLPASSRDCALGPIALDLNIDSDDWRGWNLGRHQARDLLAKKPVVVNRGCTGSVPTNR
ncbi:hypothetical protein BG844_25985 [Couchioplanes caeruleus subsp. caeruleus]|uniref:Uncharacterized protein n=1 Tax=Couchioplanes caeruleus subsp. caeruleus TaxID=56427 RepID=A0A1K0GQE9_9ACTN|nr:hypothetical protein BG844_25985 [Couchioplanes caeruleus subsp. caeruleus]